MRRDFDELIQLGIVESSGSISARKLEELTWEGSDGRRHDVTEGPCCCGAWHDITDTWSHWMEVNRGPS